MKEQIRWPLERDGNLGDTLGKTLAMTQVEGHTCPAPVLDLKLERDKGLGMRVGSNAPLFSITQRVLAIDHTWPILAAHGFGGDLTLGYGQDSAQHLYLLITHGIRVEVRWRLH